ncbi:hypothetical protein GCM10028857_20440 [Salinarchaeum chitinilyticum]
MALRATDRRSVLLATGTTIAAALSGCSNVVSQLPGNDDGIEKTDLRAAIEAYFEAGVDGDVEAFAAAVHPASPMHPDRWEGGDWEFSLEGGTVPEPIEIDSISIGATVEDVLALEHADRWFQADQLEEAIGSADLAIVEVSAEELEASDQDTWALATDDGEWTVLFASTEADTPENPEDAFEPEIRDEAGDVVAEVDWDWEQSDSGAAADADAEWARVILTDDPGVEADTVRIESTIAGTQVEFYDEQTESASTTWAGSWGSVQLNPDGDQIVVTAIDGDEATVVHRVHYEP